MDTVLGIGIIILGITGVYAALFKYSKKTHRSMKLTTSNPSLLATILASILQSLPWWVSRVFFLLVSLMAIMIGAMTLVTM
ncbi:hypothetical protein [Paenibacillus montanisoli]|uniref:Uncharacterized protein n=1 Tax=Paenibacillus montanisoli TaxID=2081970 RepID=A0A328TZS9_9BACL|nr:hypothetical protein [Paenibacillus montanisoli]RAP75949.1 hypothetical protein DL346_11000 [Paenibacillus montanisoli]